MKCKGCGSQILFVKTVKGKSMPCNAPMVSHEKIEDDERYVVTTNPRAAAAEVAEGKTIKEWIGGWIGCSLQVYVPHWVTCPARDEFRKGKK